MSFKKTENVDVQKLSDLIFHPGLIYENTNHIEIVFVYNHNNGQQCRIRRHIADNYASVKFHDMKGISVLYPWIKLYKDTHYERDEIITFLRLMGYPFGDMTSDIISHQK